MISSLHVSPDVEPDPDNKIARFRALSDTVHRMLKNETIKKTWVKFYKTLAITARLSGRKRNRNQYVAG